MLRHSPGPSWTVLTVILATTKRILLTHPQGRGRLSRALFLFRGLRSLHVSMIMISAFFAPRCQRLVNQRMALLLVV
ncbi:hypothetical protein P692DRAFT_20607101 [Suillus brevipes Sb2]|nr:hypothetical protein P692DRAFT_20607101 [Suillus brevipes Sb2]